MTAVVPDGVRATVLARMRLLDARERAVLMRAAVIGTRFEVAVLLATARYTEARVRAALVRASEEMLVAAEDAAASRYAFTHALTRDIVYAELQALHVRPIHRRIARALERSPDKHVHIEKLAYHSWAGGDLRRCARYNEAAGDAAAAVHAWSDARASFVRARDATQLGSRSYLRLAGKLALLDVKVTQSR